ncbi:MAG: DUF87 domain-containing protein, partial [Erysipelotrichaceae bacterium]|nr:DUF87 domain-containing protein [Erysipelotrichaceae bacterium]
MSNGFYNYIAKSIIGMFEKARKEGTVKAGDRFLLKLDNQMRVDGVSEALKTYTADRNMQGQFSYKDGVYTTYTIKFATGQEVIVVPKEEGMTDDFLATLRNIPLGDDSYPLLYLIHGDPIDTLESGTKDLSAAGMPFDPDTMISEISEEVTKHSNLNEYYKRLLKIEINDRNEDRSFDQNSISEYVDIWNVLDDEKMDDDQFSHFYVLKDNDGLQMTNGRKLEKRIRQNKEWFQKIDRVYKTGDIENELSKEFDTDLIKELCRKKSKQISKWYEDCTFDKLLKSNNRVTERKKNPLEIDIDQFSVTGWDADQLDENGAPVAVPLDFFIRPEGHSKSKSRKINILVFNPNKKQGIDVEFITNKSKFKMDCAEYKGQTTPSTNSSRRQGKVSFSDLSDEVVFSQVSVSEKDDDNNKYEIRICIVDVNQSYFERLKDIFSLAIKSNKQKIDLRPNGDRILINPGQLVFEQPLEREKTYSCSMDQTLSIDLDPETLDHNRYQISLNIGTTNIPIQVSVEQDRPTELTGVKAMKRKYDFRGSFDYSQGKPTLNGRSYILKETPFAEYLAIESYMVENECLAVKSDLNGYQEYDLPVPQEVKEAYLDLIREYQKEGTLPSLAYLHPGSKLYEKSRDLCQAVQNQLNQIQEAATLTKEQSNLLFLGSVFNEKEDLKVEMGPLQPLNIMYQLRLLDEKGVGDLRDQLIPKLNPLYLLPYIRDPKKDILQAIEQDDSPEWRVYAPLKNKAFQGSHNFIKKLVAEKIKQFKDNFYFLFSGLNNMELRINAVGLGNCGELLQGLVSYYYDCWDNGVKDILNITVNIYEERNQKTKYLFNYFRYLSIKKDLEEFIGDHFPKMHPGDKSELAMMISSKVKWYKKDLQDSEFEYAHITFFEMASSEEISFSKMESIRTGVTLDGLTSSTPSVLTDGFYKTEFGTRYLTEEGNDLVSMAKKYNALSAAAYTGSSYQESMAISTDIATGQEKLLDKIYDSSNWVVFIDPKVDLSFFLKHSHSDKDLMIIHYSDQYTNSSGYDDITVSSKSEQYLKIIREHLQKRNVDAKPEEMEKIIGLFNAINGEWLLKMISAKEGSRGESGYFSKEKLSILSSIKMMLALYSDPKITWIPVSLEEILRVSGGAGLSQKDGLLSAKNLGFEERPTCDDLLMVGVQKCADGEGKPVVKVFLHPVEVKIGFNESSIIDKAVSQVNSAWEGLHNVWNEEEPDTVESKLSRNFFMQLILVNAEKMALNEIFPSQDWMRVIEDLREDLLNERYVISKDLDPYLGKGTVVSFKNNAIQIKSSVQEDVQVIEAPMRYGDQFLIRSVEDLEKDSDLRDGCQFLSTYQEVQSVLTQHAEGKTQTSDDVIEGEFTEKTTDEKAAADETQPGSESADETEEVVIVEDADENEDLGAEEASEDTDPSDGSEESEPVPDGQTSDDEQPEEKNEIEVLFGTDVKTGDPVYWHPNDTQQVFHTNTGIIGVMGTGKTQFTKSLIAQLYRERKHNPFSHELGILIFDYKGDYGNAKPDFVEATNAQVYPPYHLPINPLALVKGKETRPLLPLHTASGFVSTISKCYGLGVKQRNTLKECIMKAYESKGIYR